VEEGSFSVFQFAGERLVAIDSVNRAADHMLGRRILDTPDLPTPDQAADLSFDLKSLMKRPAMAARA
jgi:3-phenylpropionate/trans-cinnamate dioxygenase ferredoxin reductase subunit